MSRNEAPPSRGGGGGETGGLGPTVEEGPGIPLLAALGSAAARIRQLAADPGVQVAVVVVVALRLVLGVTAVAVDSWRPYAIPSGDHLEAATARSSMLWPLVGPFERWDALWYLHIARDGYTPNTGDGAYEPLLPLLLRLVSVPLGGSVALAGWVVSTVALIIGLAVVWHLVADVLDPRAARLTVLLMAVYPCAFFLLAPYPEPLFLTLSAAVLLAARRRAWRTAGMLGNLVVLTRPQGAVVILALGAEAVAAAWRAAAAGSAQAAGGAGARVSPGAVLRALRPEMVAACAVPPAVLLAWFGVCRVRLGLRLGPLTPLHDIWGHRFAWPWQVVPDSIRTITAGHHPEEYPNLLLAAAVLVMLPLMWRRLPRSWTVYTAATLAIALFGEAAFSPLMSWMRYAAVLFPLFALVASWRPPAWVLWSAAAAGIGLQLWFFEGFVHYVFVA